MGQLKHNVLNVLLNHESRLTNAIITFALIKENLDTDKRNN